MTLLLPCLLTVRRASFLILKDPLFVSTREPSPAAARWRGWLQYYPHLRADPHLQLLPDTPSLSDIQPQFTACFPCLTAQPVWPRSCSRSG